MGLGTRLPDTTQGDGVKVVEPGSADDPFSKGSAADQPPVSPEGGAAPAANAGPAGEGDTSTPAPAPTEPTSTPTSEPPTAEGQPQPSSPAPAATETPATPATPAATETPPAPGATPTEPAQAPAGDDDTAVPITQAQFEEFKKEQEKQHQDQLRTQQAGQDRAMAAQRKELEDIRAESVQAREEVREIKLHGLSEDEQAKLKKQWEADDRLEGIDAYRDQVEGYHNDVDLIRLLNEYGQYGVTEEELKEIPMEERELVCSMKRSTYWEDIATGKTKPSETKNGQPSSGQPPPTQPSTATKEPVSPAGASAPSDAGGSGAPPQPPKFNDTQGPDAMAENIGQGWETPTPARRG